MKTFYLYLFTSVSLLAACSKEGSTEGNQQDDPQKKKAEAFEAAIQNHSFRLTAFYSNTPIDYDQTDNVVKAETDLWDYTRPYVRDDIDFFQADHTVVITQGDVKWAGDDAATIQRNYSVTYDKSNIYLTFVDYNYSAMKYTLSDYNSGAMLLYVDWNGKANLFSKFEVVQNP